MMAAVIQIQHGPYYTPRAETAATFLVVMPLAFSIDYQSYE